MTTDENGFSIELGLNLYKKVLSSPVTSSISSSRLLQNCQKVYRKRDDSINKGVSHKIKNPKFSKAKEAKKNRAKKSLRRMRDVKMLPSFPSDRGPIISGEKKAHFLSSPASSFFDTTPVSSPEKVPVSENHSKKRFFTSRSANAATVRLFKTIKLAAKNGTIKIAHREGGLTKKNIGKLLEVELENEIASESLKCPVSEKRIEEPGLGPTRFPRTPSPTKKDRNSLYGTPVRSSPRLKVSRNNSPIVPSTSNRKSPRKKINLVDKTDSVNGSPTKLFSPDKMGLKFLPSQISDAEGVASCRFSEDEILSTLLKENESPEKRVNFLGQLPISPRYLNMTSTSEHVSPLKQMKETNSVSEESCIDNKNVKYFPVFDRSRRKDLPFTFKINSQRKNKLAKKQFLLKKSDDFQLVLDAGQKEFGAVYCKVCSFVYEVGDPEDEKTHWQFHEGMLLSLKFTGWKRENRVTNIDHRGGWIVKISPQDPSYQWRKIEEILNCVDQDLGFSTSGIKHREKTIAYLYILEKQIVGCLIAEYIEEAFRVIQEDFTSGSDKEAGSKLICCSDVSQKICLGISRIWVFSSQRRKGIATALVDAMRSNSVYGVYLSTDQFAFSDPTQFGLSFATRYTKRPDFLVYRRENETSRQN